MAASSIGKFTAALSSLTNENTFALGNFNFDFALVKVAAPAEYGELGALMSPQRKENAEDGPLHQTARKLGALFNDIAPNTPALFAAYGKRVSEIAKEPEVNPRERNGIFAGQIGADSSSIWAAVTSGSSAIAVHLLSCMLARIFTGPEAISIWVELVKERKAQIRARYEESMYKHEYDSTLAASMQEITRDEIGIWDSSARAWLQSGDQAQMRRHKQLMLILNNLSLPVSTDESTFGSVVDSWSSAMNAMECLLKGMPQRVENGSAVLGLSAWHLYPSLMVLGDTVTNVKQHDPLFEQTAILTIGLQFGSRAQQSVSWSLPLSCLQYYGDPVRATRSVGQENSRISIHQFDHIILGCVFANWKAFAKTFEDGLDWLEKLELLLSTQTTDQKSQNSRNSQYVLWFDRLCSAARRLRTIIGTPSIECDLAKQEVNFGRRRANFIFNESHQSPAPLFGLSSIATLIRLMKGVEERVVFLRRLAQEHSLDNGNFIIQYKTYPSMSFITYQPPRFEYASVAEIPFTDAQESQNERHKKRRVQDSSRYRRWAFITAAELKNVSECSCASKTGAFLLACHNRPDVLKCYDKSAHESMLMTSSRAHCNELSHMPLWTQHRKIETLGEECLLVLDTYDSVGSESEVGRRLKFGCGSDFAAIFNEFYQTMVSYDDNPIDDQPLEFIVGEIGVAAIFRIAPFSGVSTPQDNATNGHMEQVLESGMLDTGRLFHYIYPRSSASWLRNLQACAVVTQIYSYLPHATISSLAFSQPLAEGYWCQNATNRGDRPVRFLFRLSLPEVFSCIALFDSGIYNVPADSLSQAFAMSTGNSIFVTSALLEDPHCQPNLSDVRRVPGNIGQAGISFLVGPGVPKTKAIDMNNWRLVNHNSFGGKLEDNFRQTSVHLSFTGYNMPLKTERKNRHIIDRPARLVETLVSVHDRGLWVADLNVVETLTFKKVEDLDADWCAKYHRSKFDGYSDDESSDEDETSKKLKIGELKFGIPGLHRLVCKSLSSDTTVCGNNSFETMLAKLQASKIAERFSTFTAIDNWEELLDFPQTSIAVVRTHRNWLARLAATGVLWNTKGYLVILLPAEPCWVCCGKFLIECDSASKYEPINVVLVT